MANVWKQCNKCKTDLPFEGIYYKCSVSTCNAKSTGFVFCSVSCWDFHISIYNHRNAFAEEERAPSEKKWKELNEGAPQPKPKKEKETMSEAEKVTYSTPTPADSIQVDTLVVVSKIKKLIKEQSGMNTSQCCVDELTRQVVKECLRGIQSAKQAGRKTVMGRDIN